MMAPQKGRQTGLCLKGARCVGGVQVKATTRSPGYTVPKMTYMRIAGHRDATMILIAYRHPKGGAGGGSRPRRDECCHRFEPNGTGGGRNAISPSLAVSAMMAVRISPISS
jgi:hypothetical protein